MTAYGLLVAYRQYRCTCCDNEEAIQTNHTDMVFNYCNNCSWRCGQFPGQVFGTHYYRSFLYVGPEPAPEEFNPLYHPSP